MHMNPTHQRIGLWVTLAGMILGGIGLVACARFLPPPSPDMTAEQVVQLYQTDTNLKRLGFVLMMLGNGFYFGIVAVISVQMKRIEGVGRMLNYTQLATGAVNALLLLLPSVFFTAAAFRPERSPDVTVALHDIGWFLAVMPVASFMFQQFVIALAIFADKAPQPLFPRWVAYMNIWTATLYLPAFMDTFFKTGPFAWNGLLAFWIPALIFGLIWIPVMLVFLFKAIRREEHEAAPTAVRVGVRQAA
ncbi:MAG: hypothetical protein ABW110_15290 [Steroidobacteraceae bacterium]